MKFRTIRSISLALILGAGGHASSAQIFQQGSVGPNTADNIVVMDFRIMGNPAPGCTGTKSVSVRSPSVPNPPGQETSQYFSLPAGNGPQSFEVRVTLAYSNPQLPVNGLSVYVDDQFCSSCNVTYLQTPVMGTNPAEYRYLITHQTGSAFSTNGERRFTLRFSRLGSPAPVLDMRFGAIMVGESYTDVLGYYDTPALPLYILRDPPGDGSFSKLSSGSTTCFGQSHSVSTSLDQNFWAKAKVGVAGEAGLFVTSEFELYFEAGASLTASQSETSEFEYKTCFSTSSEWTTANSGTPDDVFIGSSIRYAYGMLTKIQRPSCGIVTKTANFASTPVQRLSSYNHNESYIITTVIPEVQEQIASLTPGSIPHNKAVQQLSVWQQAIALNAAIKANAPLTEVRSFNGGGAGFGYSETQTTSETRSIQYTAILEEGLSGEFGVGVGGSGVSAGSSIKMKNEYGNGETGSNESTNTMGYTLVDDNPEDNFVVEVRKDGVFGSNVFILDSAASRTSCRYEGGFKLDQPQLWVGGGGNSTMVVTQAEIGSTVAYPLSICNGSDITREYKLLLDNFTNNSGGGAIIQTLGGLQPGLGDGIQLNIPGGQCLNTILTLQQPNPNVLDFNNINVYLYAECEEEYEPRTRSYISISAFFGEGNIGSICEPSSGQGTFAGDFIDGVQLGSINNTGSGSTSGPAYTNYSGQFSTTLSRNGQYMVSVTSGEYYENAFSVWIDYDRDGSFEASERIGSFTSSQAFQTTNIPFVVPPTASLGNTLMRVRASYLPGSDPAGMDPCVSYDFGETEDYGIVINSNTPVDCAGTPGGSAHPGTACNDNNTLTGNDTWNANCQCVGIPVDCAGVPGGGTLPGTSCDDGNPNTASDVYTANCQCAGQLIDCTGVVGGSALPGTACNDGLSSTGNDTWNANCQCVGQAIDCTGTPGGNALPGTSCNDGNPLSTNDVYDSNCQCAGTLTLDCNGVPGGPAQPGTPCDDNDPFTGGDTFGANCVCAGLPFDCAGTPGGNLLPGTPCNDGNPLTINDAFNANCACVGQLVNDCAGVPGGAAQPGTPCNDGNPSTGNDTWNVNCQCVGQPLDCTGVPGGFNLPGAPCDDGNANTGNDVYGANCVCAGQPLDCLGVPGGTATVGTPCNDSNPNTSNDVYNANCVCAGTLAADCLGVPGGSAQPGTPCNDGNAATGNDVYGANCVCAGQLIDCAGVAGGAALPGTPCNDGDPCTSNDAWGANCTCVGTPDAVGTITSPGTADASTSVTLFITPVPGATNYTWTLPPDWTSTNTSTFVLVAQTGSILGEREVCVDVTANGCALTGCTNVTVTSTTGIVENSSTPWFTVRPNPSNGLFEMAPADQETVTTDLAVFDAMGREVRRSTVVFNGAPLTMDLSEVETGTYYLVAKRPGGQRVTPLVIAH